MSGAARVSGHTARESRCSRMERSNSAGRLADCRHNRRLSARGRADRSADAVAQPGDRRRSGVAPMPDHGDGQDRRWKGQGARRQCGRIGAVMRDPRRQVAITGACFSIIGIAMNCAVVATTLRRRPRSSSASSRKLAISAGNDGTMCPQAAKASIGTGTGRRNKSEQADMLRLGRRSPNVSRACSIAPGAVAFGSSSRDTCRCHRS